MSCLQKLVLASTSPYRKALLERFGLPFATVAPDIDESRQTGENAKELVRRLAKSKALAVAGSEPDSVIIGSDQVAELGGVIIGKPCNHDNAFSQLKSMRAKLVYFHTGLCVVNNRNSMIKQKIITYKVNFRDFSDEEIERYLRAEQPYNCAASFKSEAMGITLLKGMEGPDPTALVGLPLIELADILRKQNYNIP